MPPGMGIIIIQNQLLTSSRRPLPIAIPIPHRRGRRHIVQLDMPSAITTNQRRDIRLGVPRRLRPKPIVPRRRRSRIIILLPAITRPDPSSVPEQRLDTGQRDDDSSDEALAICPTQGDAERCQGFERVVGTKNGADHDEDAGGKHGGEDCLAVQGDLEFHEDGDGD